MPSPFFVAGAFNLGFSGVALVMPDDGVSTNVIALPTEAISLSNALNNSYANLIDNSSIMHNKNGGMIMGNLRAGGPLKLDRFFQTIINTGFGPRTSPSTGGLVPWYGTLKQTSGSTPYSIAGLWWSDMVIAGRFGVGGQQSRLNWNLAGMVLDPNNVLAATNLAIPSVSGTIGSGISTYAATTFSNGAASTPTIYDGVRSFTLRLSNGLVVQPSVKDVSNRIAAGCSPNVFMGTLDIVQMVGATNPVPMTNGVYPFTVVIPDGANSHTLTLNMSVSYDADGQSQAASDFNANAVSYTLFGTQSSNSATYPIVAVYA